MHIHVFFTSRKQVKRFSWPQKGLQSVSVLIEIVHMGISSAFKLKVIKFRNLTVIWVFLPWIFL